MPQVNQSAETCAPPPDTEAPSLERAFSFEEAFDEQQRAFAALPEYEVKVVSRKTHKELEHTDIGTFAEETVRYSDGAVRLVTLGIPNERNFRQDGGVSPHGVLAGDPLFTGPSGLNKDKMERFLRAGFGFVWNHHQGRHSLLPTSRSRAQTIGRFLASKSVGKSAHHSHALLNDLDATFPYDLRTLLAEGYSRSSMSGEAFVALSPLYDRLVALSDYDATCFLKRLGLLGTIAVWMRQAPGEAVEAIKVGKELAEDAISEGSMRKIIGHTGTFDPNPLNAVHEIAWAPLLINGDSGMYAAAVPLDHNGIRTQGSRDYMSQPEDLQAIHTNRPGIVHMIEQGAAHLFGARPSYLDKKFARYDKARRYMIEHGGSVLGITAADVLASPSTAELQPAA